MFVSITQFHVTPAPLPRGLLSVGKLFPLPSGGVFVGGRPLPHRSKPSAILNAVSRAPAAGQSCGVKSWPSGACAESGQKLESVGVLQTNNRSTALVTGSVAFAFCNTALNGNPATLGTWTFTRIELFAPLFSFFALWNSVASFGGMVFGPGLGRTTGNWTATPCSMSTTCPATRRPFAEATLPPLPIWMPPLGANTSPTQAELPPARNAFSASLLCTSTEN